MDCEAISRFEKDPAARVSLQEEVRLTAEHHAQVQALTPEAAHLWLLGNHEDRFRRLLWKLAEKRDVGELLGLEALTNSWDLAVLTGVDKWDWEVMPYPRHKLLFDRLVLTHGSTVRKWSAYSAKAEYERYRKSGMSGHTHRRGVHEHRDYDTTNAWWELGCLCSIRADYTVHPDWAQGFAVVTWSKDRTEFGVEEVRINEGVTFFRGQRYESRVKV